MFIRLGPAYIAEKKREAEKREAPKIQQQPQQAQIIQPIEQPGKQQAEKIIKQSEYDRILERNKSLEEKIAKQDQEIKDLRAQINAHNNALQIENERLKTNIRNNEREQQIQYNKERDLEEQIKQLREQLAPRQNQDQDAFRQINLQNIVMRTLEPVLLFEDELLKLDDNYKQQFIQKLKIIPIAQRFEAELKSFIKAQLSDIVPIVNEIDQKLKDEARKVQTTIQFNQQQDIEPFLKQQILQPLQNQLQKIQANHRPITKMKEYIKI